MADASFPDDDSEVDVNVAFAEIVSRLDMPSADGHSSREARVVSEGAHHRIARDTTDPDDDVHDDWLSNGPHKINAPPVFRGPHRSLLDEDDEAFIPPVRPPLTPLKAATVLAWLVALGSPFFLLIAAFFWPDIPNYVVLGVLVSFIASCLYLASKLPTFRDPDDDGAIV